MVITTPRNYEISARAPEVRKAARASLSDSALMLLDNVSRAREGRRYLAVAFHRSLNATYSELISPLLDARRIGIDCAINARAIIADVTHFIVKNPAILEVNIKPFSVARDSIGS